MKIRTSTLRHQLTEIQNKRRAARKNSSRHSRLDSHKAEIMAMVVSGASYRDIALWLRQYRQVEVQSVTVWRRVKYWRNGGVAS